MDPNSPFDLLAAPTTLPQPQQQQQQPVLLLGQYQQQRHALGVRESHRADAHLRQVMEELQIPPAGESNRPQQQHQHVYGAGAHLGDRHHHLQPLPPPWNGRPHHHTHHGHESASAPPENTDVGANMHRLMLQANHKHNFFLMILIAIVMFAFASFLLDLLSIFGVGVTGDGVKVQSAQLTALQMSVTALNIAVGQLAAQINGTVVPL